MTHTVACTLRRLLCGTAIAGMTASVAFAAAAAPGDQSSAVSVGEVVVTAQKRAERLITVPAPVTALGAGQLTRLQAVRLDDYAANVPGMNLVADRAGETAIVLRGITTGSPISSTVATYIDDTPYGSSTSFALGGWLFPDLDPGDLKQIEVLRGPQGTLYGASSLGGLIKFVTAPPNLNHYAGRIEVDGSTVDHGGDGYGVRAMVNAPIIPDTLALRISAYDRRDPGFIDDPQLGVKDLNHTDVYGGHAALLWTPNAKLAVTLSAITQDLYGAGTSDEDVTVTASGGITPTTGDLEHVRYTAEPLAVRYRLFSGDIAYDLGWASLSSITSYSILGQSAVFDETPTFGALGTELTGIPNFGTSTGSLITMRKWTQEVRLSSPTGQQLEWQGGFYFTTEHSDRYEPTANFDTVTGAQTLPANTLFFASLISTYTEYAGYGDLTYHFTPKFDVMGGVRYGTNKQDYSTTESGVFVGGASASAGTSSDQSTTFLVTPRYKFDDNNMLYARVASGYRPGGPNAPSPAEIAAGVPLAYRPDTLTDYDVGYKASLYNRMLTLDLSAFHIDWHDIQILTDFNGVTSDGNGGTAVSDGVEASAVLTPIHGLTLSGNAAYTDARLTEDAPGVNGKDGDELPNVPKWAFALNADYDFAVTGEVAGFVGGSVHYVGDRVSGFVSGSPPAFARPVLPNYTTVDLRAGLSYHRTSLELYVKNVGDARGFNNITSLALSGYTNPFTASVIQPRTVGVSLSASF